MRAATETVWLFCLTMCQALANHLSDAVRGRVRQIFFAALPDGVCTDSAPSSNEENNYGKFARAGVPALKAGYQVVVLDIGQVYFRKIAGLGDGSAPDDRRILHPVGLSSSNHDKKNVPVP